MSPEQLEAALRVTIGDIEDELAAIQPLLNLGAARDLDFIETAAAAQIIQSVYTGIEASALFIAKRVDGKSPAGTDWHRQLLISMSAPTDRRPPLFGQTTIASLGVYLDFRHVVRHNYARRLKSDRVRELLLGIVEVWKLVRGDWETFILDYANQDVPQK